MSDVEEQEVGAFFLAPLIWTADEAIGTARVDLLLSQQGVTRQQAHDRTGWVRLSVCEGLCEALSAEIDDPTFFERCGRAGLSRRAMGLVRPLLRTVGDPLFAYQQAAAAAARFNKVGNFTCIEHEAGRLTMTYRTAPGAPRETSRFICVTRHSQMATLPTLLDLPAARIEHDTCMHQGADACIYRIHYQPRRRPWRAAALAAAATASISALGIGLGWSWLAIGIASICTGSAVLLGMHAMMLQRTLSSRIDELTEAHDALTQYAHVNERRYQDLLTAKGGVEAEVERRTESLSRTRDQLTEMLDRVRSSSENRQAFFATISHELRTPLQLLTSPLEDLKAGREPAGGAAFALSMMGRQVQRLRTLLDDLLSLASEGEEAIALRLVSVEVVVLLEELVMDLQHTAQDHQLSLTLTTPEPPVSCHLDPSWLSGAVVNLITNAVRVCEPGCTISVTLQADDDTLSLTVLDNGPGIPAADQERLFERFEQGSEPGSVGLGLAIVQEAARLHGGSVRLESTPGAGACFQLQLPRQTRDVRQQLRSPTPASLPLTPPPQIAGAGSPLALIVEDNPDIRMLVSHILAPHYRILLAADGLEGLEVAARDRPDLVVTDVSMPRLGGIELVQQLREGPQGGDIVLLVLTAFHDHETVLSAYDAGADDFLAKPFHGRELLARAEVHLRMRALVRQTAHAERLASLGVLAASVAHQIRNPLSAIRTGVALISRHLPEDLPPRTQRLPDVIDASVERIARITHDLLYLSGKDRGGPRSIPPSEGLRSVVRMFEVAGPVGVTYQTDIQEGHTVRARPGELSHVWLSLIDNAARAASDGGTVKITAAALDGLWQLRIEDSGPGIPADLTDRIFEPFFTTRAPGEGTGLGLSIAERAIRESGGTIKVRRSQLGGAMMVVELPLLSEPPLEPAPAA